MLTEVVGTPRVKIKGEKCELMWASELTFTRSDVTNEIIQSGEPLTKHDRYPTRDRRPGRESVMRKGMAQTFHLPDLLFVRADLAGSSGGLERGDTERRR